MVVFGRNFLGTNYGIPFFGPAVHQRLHQRVAERLQLWHVLRVGLWLRAHCIILFPHCFTPFATQWNHHSWLRGGRWHYELAGQEDQTSLPAKHRARDEAVRGFVTTVQTTRWQREREAGAPRND